MIVAKTGCINQLPNYWCHDPTLKDKMDFTVAMLTVTRGNISTLPEQWYHSPTLTGKCGITVAIMAA